MDHFVESKLIEWGLREYVEKFKDQKITKASLFVLNDKDIEELFPKIGYRSIFRSGLDKLKDKLLEDQPDSLASSDDNSKDIILMFEQHKPLEVMPSTSSKENAKGKRKLDLQAESHKPPTKRQCDSEANMLSEVDDIMRDVSERLNGQDKINDFLKNKISGLKTDKRELIGVFGRTGAGKSSLINAIIGQNLFPAGSVRACTSVMIKVEANTCSSKYEADIEFIKKEEWEDELRSLKTLKEGNEDYREMIKKLSALYGNEWEKKSPQFFMERKHFRNILEFFHSEKKSLEYDTAQELSKELSKYTKDGSKQDDGNTEQQWYWPLVKYVTVRVPSNDLPRHVTFVDLPGNGDRNKSRNEMWKKIVGDCSTVWIVAEITRAASEIEAWEILEKTFDRIGNGGQCQQIHFICTKSDPSHHRVTINKDAKEEVKDGFQELNRMSKYFSEGFFKVFTVSADEFLTSSSVKEDENEIPKLQDFLRHLNKCHSETFIYRYVSGAYGILSLIEGANLRKQSVEKEDDVCKELEENMNKQLNQVETAVEEAIKVFEQCLTDGVKNSKTSEEKLKSFLDRDKERSFFSTLQSVVKKDGIHRTKKGEYIDLNMMLVSCLTDSIDEKFRKTFPNDVQGESFNRAISNFSLIKQSVIDKYKDVELQLIFLQTEEETIKADINKIILEQKKIIYNSLQETIERNMKKCYEDAKIIEGDFALKNMRETIEKHVYSNQQMYEEAKETLLMKMNDLKETILEKLEEPMKKSIEHSLKTDAYSLPVVSEHFGKLKKYYDELKGRQDEIPQQ